MNLKVAVITKNQETSLSATGIRRVPRCHVEGNQISAKTVRRGSPLPYLQRSFEFDLEIFKIDIRNNYNVKPISTE
jgi:hypothetical protein